MKNVLFLALFFLGIQTIYPQEPTTAKYSYIITPKKIYLRYKHRRPDSLVIPEVSGKYPALKKALSDTNLFNGDTRDSIVNQYKETGSGTISFYYDVFFVNKNVMSLKLYSEGVGAYLSTSQHWRTLNIQTGKPYPINAEINEAGLKWIYMNYMTLLRKRIKEDRAARLTDKTESPEYIIGIYKQLSESVDTISFNGLMSTYIFTDKGVVFTTEGIFPHATQAFEINREWFIPYHKLIAYRLPAALVIKKKQ